MLVLNKDEQMLSAAELQNIKIDTLETGHKYLAEITNRRAALLAKMQDPQGGAWQQLCDERYDLSQARNHIQHAMNKIVKERRNARV